MEPRTPRQCNVGPGVEPPERSIIPPKQECSKNLPPHKLPVEDFPTNRPTPNSSVYSRSGSRVYVPTFLRINRSLPPKPRPPPLCPPPPPPPSLRYSLPRKRRNFGRLTPSSPCAPKLETTLVFQLFIGGRRRKRSQAKQITNIACSSCSSS